MAKTEIIAENLFQLFKQLSENQNLQPSKLHIIGQGLGAHIASIAAKKMIAANLKISRITGKHSLA